MSEVNFTAAMDFIWHPQRDGHQQDSAPGEAFRTSWGVVQDTWNHAVNAGIVKGSLRDATKTQCEAIYRCFFWNMMAGDLLPPGLDVQLFEQGCLAGPGTAVKILQRNVGLRGRDVDGVIGPKTRAEIAKCDTHKLIDLQRAGFTRYLSSLRNYETFKRGWGTREAAAAELAHELCGPLEETE